MDTVLICGRGKDEGVELGMRCVVYADLAVED